MVASIEDEEGLLGERDFFAFLRKNLKREIRLFSIYPNLMQFQRSAYFEEDPEVAPEITRLKTDHIKDNNADFLKHIDRCKFKDPNAPEILLTMITLCIEGYMSSYSVEVFSNPELAMEKMEAILTSLEANYKK